MPRWDDDVSAAGRPAAAAGEPAGQQPARAAGGLASAECFASFLDKECAAALRGRRLAVVVFQLDQLAGLRAAQGAVAAEAALQQFGDTLAAVVRRMNLATRLGDDRFACTVADATMADVMAFVSRVAQHAHRPGTTLPLTLSVGIAEFELRTRTPGALLAAACDAAQAAHDAGGNAVRTRPASQEETVRVRTH